MENSSKKEKVALTFLIIFISILISIVISYFSFRFYSRDLESELNRKYELKYKVITINADVNIKSNKSKVNVNVATKDELKSLPQIGDKLAENIIKNRPYLSLKDLSKVQGIGERTLLILEGEVSF